MARKPGLPKDTRQCEKPAREIPLPVASSESGDDMELVAEATNADLPLPLLVPDPPDTVG